VNQDRAESLRVVDRVADYVQPLRLRATVGVSAVVVVAIAVIAAVRDTMPSATLLLLLVALVIIATHRETFFGDETAMSASIVVVVASVIAFQGDGMLVGPLACCVVGALHIAHVRERAWSKVIVNTAATSLAAAGAAFALVILGFRESAIRTAIGLAIAAAVYWFINNLATGAALTIVTRDRVSPGTLLRSETQMLVFAVAGALCGLLFLEVGLWAGAISLIVVLVAVDLLVISRPRPSSTRANHTGLATAATRVAGGGLAALAAFVLGAALYPVVGAVLGAAAGIIGLAVASLIALRRRSGIWDVQLAIGLALADAPYVAVASVAGGVGAATTLGIGAVVAIAGALAVGVVLSRRRRSIEQARRLDDTEILAMLELVRAERRQPQLG
jgi:hypothetical protein